MAKKKDEKTMLVSLDIGTSKVVALIGEINPDGTLEIVGVGDRPSHGLKKGVIVDIELTVQSIAQALEDAKKMAGCNVHSAYVSVSGSHIRSFNSDGVTAIRNKQEVTADDVAHVLESARAVAIPEDQVILHALPYEFVIDKQEGIIEPIGMAGVRLEAKVHIVTAAKSALQNIHKCIQKCNLEVDQIILQPLAASRAVLTDDEKELGVCLVDIGGGTTDIVVYVNGAISHTAVIPVGGNQVTNDIAMAFRTSKNHAERLKLKHGCCMTQLVRADEQIDVEGLADQGLRQMPREKLAEVIEPRYDEFFKLIQTHLQRSGFENLIAAGLVLTGGSSRIEGVTELAESIFHLPIRQGGPRQVTAPLELKGNPVYATAVGLLLFGYENPPLKSEPLLERQPHTWWEKMARWLKGNF